LVVARVLTAALSGDVGMPIIIAVNHEAGKVNAIAIGNVTYADVESHLVAEKHFGGLGYRELVDMRGAAVSWSPNEVDKIVALVQRMSLEVNFGATAVLVSTNSAFGIIRMLEILLDGTAEVKPFRQEDEALQWLASRMPRGT
jgi:hypothetical protein